MKVSIVRGGGLAGITTRTELDSDELPADAARDLEAKVEAAGIGDMQTKRAPAHADDLAYEVAVKDADRTQRLRVMESTLPEPVRELVTWVDGRPERHEEIG